VEYAVGGGNWADNSASLRQLRQMRRNDRFMKFGKHVRYKIADVEAWEDAHYAEQAGS
jgi:hypothetical protein